MILRYIRPRPRLLPPTRLAPLLAVRRHNATLAPSSPPPPDLPPPETNPPTPTPPAPPERKTASFYISNVFPIMLARWDIRPALASFREENLMERLHDIASEITGNGFRIESWEIARKDGGVLLHFSYIPPAAPPPASEKEERDLSVMNALPERPSLTNVSPGRLFLPQLIESAKNHGGFPFWLGQWWSTYVGGSMVSVPGHKIWRDGDASNPKGGITSVGENDDTTKVKGNGSGLSGIQASMGGGRVWLVKGRQWTEDMNRFPSNRLRVEFDGPDVSQEMLYILFRPYGRVTDIQPPQPVPAGSLRYATVSFSRLSPATTAITTLHGYSTPTNTADFTLRVSGEPLPESIKLSRLRIYYERPLKAHAIRDWISSHPRIALPVIAFLIGTLSYTFFDPIRAFFVRSKVEGVWDLEKYSLVKWVKDKFGMLNKYNLFSTHSSANSDGESSVGKNAWADRVEAERSVERWLSEFPSTFIYITGPPGSGKASLAERVLKQQNKPALVIDCAEIAKSKNDAALLSSLADQTGYYPVFSFLSSINGLIDLASVGLIGQKAGFSTPVDQQLRSILEVVGGALRDTSAHARKEHLRHNEQEADRARVRADHERRRELIIRGGWHDGRLDCVAGNGVMSELGLGEEPAYDGDLLPPPPPLLDDVAPIKGEAVPPTAESIKGLVNPPSLEAPKVVPKPTEVDEESELIKTLPIVVLKNFAQKTAKGDLWNVLAEWGASLVENKVAHVIVVTEGPTGTKALTRALPSKPLNSVSLADADETNSLAYVRDKLAGGGSAASLSSDDSTQISKLGGRMVDLETLVYKVRTGAPIKEAVDDIVRRNVVELRKQTFGDDAEDAKSLPWTRAQAWKIVSELAKSSELSYAKMLQEFPFKGAESSLKAMEEHELIGLSYFEGRPSLVRPGKPVFHYAFQSLVNDSVFKASSQIEYNNAVIAKAEGEIRAAEEELSKLQSITADGGTAALGIDSWLKGSAIRDRAGWLLERMAERMEKVNKLEKENAAMMKVLSQSKA